MPSAQPDPQVLLDAARASMPFGRYRDRRLIDLPESYLVWFHQRGWPPGRLGMLLATVYEARLNGLEALLRRLGEAS